MKRCPVCDNEYLNTMLTKQGIMVDLCYSCEGIWMGRDVIYHFTKDPEFLRLKLKEALDKKWMSVRKSPVSGESMFELPMFEGDAHINYCLQSGGIWLDKAEKDRFPPEKCSIDIDPALFEKKDNFVHRSLQADVLSNLPDTKFPLILAILNVFFTSALLFTIIFSVLGLPVLAGILFSFIYSVILFMAGPLIFDLLVRIIYKIKLINPIDLQTGLQEFINETCKRFDIKFPQIGIINDDTPYSFSYGFNSNNGYVVLTKGLFETLDEDELKSIIAHEIGHLTSWDVWVMSTIHIAPLFFYSLYRKLYSFNNDKKKSFIKTKNVLSVLSYFAYVLSVYPGFWLAKSREMYADLFAANATGKPDKMIKALVKLSYGVAGAASKSTDKIAGRTSLLSGGENVGILNFVQSKAFSVGGFSFSRNMSGEVDREALFNAISWDIWNPWAKYYEFHFSHPLFYKRIILMNNLSLYFNQEPYFDFNDNVPESYYYGFLFDMIINLLPVVVLFFGFILSIIMSVSFFVTDKIKVGDILSTFVPLIFFVGLAYLIKVLYSSPGGKFNQSNVRSLLNNIRVSNVMSVPCRLKGKIIGRGIPGLIYSGHFVFEDDTGIIFLDYFNPLSIINNFFSLFRYGDYNNIEAEIIGWYRRAPVPFIEVKTIKIANQVRRCHTHLINILISIALIIAGILLVFV